MLLHPELLGPLAEVVEAFANLRSIESVDQVHELFLGAVLQVSRPLRPKLQVIEPEKVGAYRKDQAAVRHWLGEVAMLDRSTPRLTSQTARHLRGQLAPTLRRMHFGTALAFSEHGAELRLLPSVVGVEAACYLVIASALEHRTTLRVGRCPEDEFISAGADRCENFVIHAGGRGKPRTHCAEHSELRKHRRRD